MFSLLECLPPTLFFSDAKNKNCEATQKLHPIIDGRKQSATNTKYCITLLHATLRNCYAAAITTTDGQRQQQKEGRSNPSFRSIQACD
mmetsp:Transcript_7094/g.10329  ORF Transcript_7094/g.10329 Transcript_7094/m.10329 type:complete len:88 (-) Transcript_7094:236-499(-)